MRVFCVLVMMLSCSVCFGNDRWSRWDASDAAFAARRAERDMSSFLSQQQLRRKPMQSHRLRVELECDLDRRLDLRIRRR